MQELDLSSNNFSGFIPTFLEKFSYLQYLNLSFNDFEGAVPTEGVFRNASAFSVMGNRRLCGGISNLHLPSCFDHEFGKKEKHIIIILASIISALVLIVLILLAVFRRKLCITRRSKSLDRQLIDVGHIKVTYGELLRATSGFSSQNLIGIGGFGSVYKGFNVCGEPVVAVKVFNLTDQGASKSCMNECHALRHIRHRNLVKVITACSSVNFQGNEFMALVYEYMPNGNLDQWLL
ncbi:probable LRR receptor-like serine/threonine-protein kinase At3g47570 [Dioscorea cayenensis subsp. rotundata]|uniref:Probable LRR receptor-like serine/threonine-protein kinase At3g47570 n=1 Tax=Dioscorea cayennensis subsp. rotundata TaxID=55577 RepID=A0AB40CWD8_DIOCR|nr:probable LRR receptor-like serine/threonine-protein kinase At3g47570 [Dioscorea cayenensis subsp. rotundata]